jgi:hypothetical protein
MMCRTLSATWDVSPGFSCSSGDFSVGTKYVSRFFFAVSVRDVNYYRQHSAEARLLQLIKALKSFLIGRFAFSFFLPFPCMECLLCTRSGFLPIYGRFLPVQDRFLVIGNGVLFSVRGHGIG